ncbi:hypothetical protein KJ059_19035 [Myxococcota bacterium]|nr:hypothetical protein [Myxococcota bacterium]MCZ7617999.1 gluconate 2-dehydrogenase subunit 3 family protein [Myxococcota bacterium]
MLPVQMMMFLFVLGALLLFWAVARLLLGYGASDASLRQLSARETAFLAAAADAVFPPGGLPIESGSEAGVVRHIDGWLALLTRRNRVLIRLLLVFFEHATLLFPAPGRGGFRRFSSLSPAQRIALLEVWEHSSWRVRRLFFASLRTILTSSYFASPSVLRELGLAPLAIETPVVEADLLYPRIGRSRASIRWRVEDVTVSPSHAPLDPRGALHPDYVGADAGMARREEHS